MFSYSLGNPGVTHYVTLHSSDDGHTWVTEDGFRNDTLYGLEGNVRIQAFILKQ